MKNVIAVLGGDRGHWVGDGFPVQTLFSYDDQDVHTSPFLMLDYAAPYRFPPTSAKRGVGSHPHRGFETVTIVYDGEISHKDSTGQGGIIGPGEVQWMTAGAGILHEEFHSERFAQDGGMLEMVQLWVNLPAQFKMVKPSYQSISRETIPTLQLQNNVGYARVIAGAFEGVKGPARTFTPMNVVQLQLERESSIALPAPNGWNALLVVLRGSLDSNGSIANSAQMLVYGNDHADIQISTLEDSTCLLLTGEPINESVVGYGPFVMNNEREIEAAISDFRSGKFGYIS